MSELEECVMVSSGEDEEDVDEAGCAKKDTGTLLRGTKSGASNASAIEVEGLGDDTSESNDSDRCGDSDCEIVSVDGVQGEEKWRNVRGSVNRLNRLLQAGHSDPRLLLTRIFRLDETVLPDDQNQLWGLLLSLLSEPEPRHRLKHINSLENVIDLLANAKHVLVVTGAGVSVSCGIPDFRSRDGIYARLAKDYPDLSSPQAMFDLTYFLQNPEPFFKFAKEIFPGQFMPSLTHRFVALLEERSQLLRNYTQNIDTLEQAAGITRLIQCHGSFATASCTTCKHRVPGNQIKESIFAQVIPRCPKCGDSPAGDSASGSSAAIGSGVMKPDIVFFGEDLSAEFHDTLAGDVKQTDLVLVIGSSLKVRPVAHIPNAIPGHVPQVLINREPLSSHEFDVELLGDCDVIVRQLCLRLGWQLASEPMSGDQVAEADDQAVQFSYVPFTELLGCPVALQSPGDKASSSPSESAPATTGGGGGGGGETTQAVPADSEPISVEAEVVSKPESLAEDLPVEITDDSDDGDAERSEDDDMWEVAASLSAGSFTMISSHQYVFPGAEVYFCKSVRPELADAAEDEDYVDDDDDEEEGDEETGDSVNNNNNSISSLSSSASSVGTSASREEAPAGQQCQPDQPLHCATEADVSTPAHPANSVNGMKDCSHLGGEGAARPGQSVGETAKQGAIGDAGSSPVEPTPPVSDTCHDNGVGGGDGEESACRPTGEKRARLCEPLTE